MEPNSFKSSQPHPPTPDPEPPSSPADSANGAESTPPATPESLADPIPGESTPPLESASSEEAPPVPEPVAEQSEADESAPIPDSAPTESAPVPDSAPIPDSEAAVSPSLPASAPTRLWLPILALNVLIVVGVAVRVFTDPRVGNLQAYEFPETIEIEGWNFTESESIKPVEKPEYEGSSYRAGRHYRYRQGRTPLDVEIRYVTETLGGVDLFTREHERFQGKADGEEIVALIRQSPETGAFAQLTYDDYAYISTCINPRGLSTVSPDQFQRNQELYDTVMDRVIPWLLGRDRWRDDRCLWTLMYIPLGDDPDQTQDQLEAAWRDWFDTWEGQFPPL